ncbi:MAG: hypothetical protein ABI467_01915 [Kofleriaceae bacterium]
MPARPAPGGDAKLQDALGRVDLLAGEQIYFTLQADGLFLGVNPFAKLMSAINGMLMTLTGGHFRVFLVVTNQRLLVIRSSAVWCGCARTQLVRSMALASVKEVASEKATQICCVHTRLVQVHSITERWNLAIKKLGDAEIRQFLTNLSSVIVAHSTRAGV